MAEMGKNIKRRIFQGMDALGKKASQLAKSAQQKLEKLDAERQLEDLDNQISQEARRLWENGEVLPQSLCDLLTERKQLESTIRKPETEEELPVPEETPNPGDGNE